MGPQIIDRLGHRGRELSILKMDCEGCEWDSLDMLATQRPETFSAIRVLQAEFHYWPNAKPAEEQIRIQARVAEHLSGFTVYAHSTNSDTSRKRTKDTPVLRDLVRAGVPDGTCCHEFSFGRLL